MSHPLTRASLYTFLLCVLSQCCPPPISYTDSPKVLSQRSELQDQLLALLPESQQSLSEAKKEAQWLSDTSYKAATAIALVNDSCWSNWFGNYLINLNFRDRGLCWHYQHDMFRELRRRELQFFRLGTCVRDEAKMSEHNCLYISALDDAWPRAYMLDAWIGNGKLEVEPAWELNLDRWKESTYITALLNWAYPINHAYPIEQWFRIKDYKGDYTEFWAESARQSEQYRRMYDNIEKGKQEHPDKLYTY